MPFDADDLAAFVDPDMPGYVLATIAGSDVPGLFSNGYVEALGMAGSSPSFHGTANSLSGVVQGDAVTIGGAGYTVAGVEPSSAGMTRLRLSEA